MCLIQRSGDMLTASGPGGINEVQYAALLMMIARHTGYESGVFTHVVANEQIYDRHEDAAEEMKARYSERDIKEKYAWDDGYQGDENEWMFQQPKLILNPEQYPERLESILSAIFSETILPFLNTDSCRCSRQT